MTKVQSHVILVRHNMRMVASNVRKNKGTTECDKSTVISDVGNTQCEDDTLNVRKNKETTKCDKSIVTCDIGTKQCEDGTIKCEKK